MSGDFITNTSQSCTNELTRHSGLHSFDFSQNEFEMRRGRNQSEDEHSTGEETLIEEEPLIEEGILIEEGPLIEDGPLIDD